ncbi:NADH-quinone oxidoreductase subunit C [Falsibacillus albus]|uniref:NADH-quinone oxidoreductase subunit C n=2 Tax=Falsibacillus albus TaxID=2478915 RepID=A0A3L7JHM9_9BACI|nr:NADH-quinone oxidoreductase subunit C [Falsibacillus albus]
MPSNPVKAESSSWPDTEADYPASDELVKTAFLEDEHWTLEQELDLQRQKADAAAKAREEALAKKKAKQTESSKPEEPTTSADDLAKQKAEAAAKAKAAALAKKKAKEAEAAEPAESEPSPDDLAKQKAEAAAKAKAAALAKKKAKEAEAAEPAESVPSADDLAKQKAEAAAKAKAAALARKKAKEAVSDELSDEDLAKKKAVAAAKAKAAALAKQKRESGGDATADEKAKAVAAAKAKAAAAAKAKALGKGKEKEMEEAAAPERPSPNEPFLNRYTKIVSEKVGKQAVEEAYINRLSKDVPTLVIEIDSYIDVLLALKQEEGFTFLSELHGTDFGTHMEVFVQLSCFAEKKDVSLKVKLDREAPAMPSAASIFQGAEWPECEVYDLLGIRFDGHPNLHRIFLGEDWVGFPLRKDYEAYDEEV